jgi:hypothetical protein
MEKYFNMYELGLYIWLVQNSLMLTSTQNLVQTTLSRQDSYNRTPREIYNYIDKRDQLTIANLH